jgi:hypothetical protein
LNKKNQFKKCPTKKQRRFEKKKEGKIYNKKKLSKLPAVYNITPKLSKCNKNVTYFFYIPIIPQLVQEDNTKKLQPSSC